MQRILPLVGAILVGLPLLACGGPAAPSPVPTPRVNQPLTPFPQATLAPAPISASPTPRPTRTNWVQARLDAVIALYNISDEGAALLRRLDLRQMKGEPGFFGSYGFKSWAGVGEAKPYGVMHELSHSYWGGFPVEGLPSLSWETPPGAKLSPAMQR